MAPRPSTACSLAPSSPTQSSSCAALSPRSVLPDDPWNASLHVDASAAAPHALSSAAPSRWSRPLGARVGWIDRENLYLDTASAMSVVSTLGQRTEDALNVSATTLRKRLNERGMLLTTDAASASLEVRRVLEGQKRRVLHLLASRLFQDQDTAITQDQPPNGENGAGCAGCGIGEKANPALN